MCSRCNQIGPSLPVGRVRLSRKDPDLTARIVICDPNPVRAARLSAPLAADGCRVRCEVTVPSDIGTAAHGDVLLLSVELWTAEQLQAARLEASFQAHVIVVLSSTDAEVATRYVEAGARDLLMPPFLPEQVIRRVRSASRWHHDDRQASSSLVGRRGGRNGQTAHGVCASDPLETRTGSGSPGIVDDRTWRGLSLDAGGAGGELILALRSPRRPFQRPGPVWPDTRQSRGAHTAPVPGRSRS